MCEFFSFVTDGNQNVFYFGSKDRANKKLMSKYTADSHTSIAAHFLKDPIADDKVNKFEYIAGKFVIDQINVKDDSAFAETWIKKFCKSEEFQSICLAAVKQEGWALRDVKEQTPEICLAAIKQNGWALQHVKKQTPEICLEAVKQNGWALQHVKKQTPEICLEAVKQTGDVLEYVKPKFLDFVKSNI